VTAKDLRGFGPAGILSIVAILFGNTLFLPLSAILVLVWAHLSKTPWKELGFSRPRSWIASIAIGIAFGAAFKIAMKALIMPLFHAPPVNQPFHYLEANPAAIPATLYLLIAGAGFGEETVFRGYLFERFRKLFGAGAVARIATVAITSVWFAAGHYSFQGWPGVQQALIVGIVFGSIFATTRSIWMLMFAHASFDLTAYAMIYWGWEARVAHWLF